VPSVLTLPGTPAADPGDLHARCRLAAARRRLCRPGRRETRGAPAVRESAAHFGIPWNWYRLVSVPELAAAAGVLAGLWLHPLGVAAAAGMAVLIAAALVAHGRERDDIKTMAPAVVAAVITAA
jgi:DoxX-like family